VAAAADVIIQQQLVQHPEVVDKEVELTTQQLPAEQIQVAAAAVQDTAQMDQLVAAVRVW
jgi:hypothetical protein